MGVPGTCCWNGCTGTPGTAVRCFVSARAGHSCSAEAEPAQLGLVTERSLAIVAQPGSVADSPLQQPCAAQQPGILRCPRAAWQQAEVAPRQLAISQRAVVVSVVLAGAAGHRGKAGQPVTAPRAGTAGHRDEAGARVAAEGLFNSARECRVPLSHCSVTVPSTSLSSLCGLAPRLCAMVG